MTALQLPALDGRSPLGFLAALGVLRLVGERGHPHARLSWSPSDCTAQLHRAHSSVDALARTLRQVVDGIPDGGVLPQAPADFPPPGEAPDKLRLPRAQLRNYVETLSDQIPGHLETWLSSLVTDLSLDEKGRADISLFTAPSGKQSMRTMLEKPLAAVRDNPHSLSEALLGWRRYPGVTGEYLDHRVLYDAADAPNGKSMERGVPGATWLALMAYPLLLTSAEGRESTTSGWQRIRGRSARPRLVYPLWSTPVDTHAAATLLTHPVLLGAQPGNPPDAARAASIFLVCAAERRRIPGRTFAGVLTPVPPPSSSRGGDRSSDQRPTPARDRSSPRQAKVL